MGSIKHSALSAAFTFTWSFRIPNVEPPYMRTHGIPTPPESSSSEIREKAECSIHRQDRPSSRILNKECQSDLPSGKSSARSVGRERADANTEIVDEEGIDYDELRVAESAGQEANAEVVWIDRVFADLESTYYACAASDIPAASVGSPQIRQRLWWVGISESFKRWPEFKPTRAWERWGGLEGNGRMGSAGDARLTGDGCGQAEPASAHRPIVDRPGVPGGLRNTEQSGLEVGTDDGSVREGTMGASTRQESVSADDVSNSAVGLAHAGHDAGLTESDKPLQERVAGARESGDERVGLDSTASTRPVSKGSESGLGQRRLRGPESRCGLGAWSDYDIIPFKGEVYRRVERGTFPLVARLPKGMVPSCYPSESYVQETSEARNMRLIGYGNSIVPQVGAMFIETVLELI